MYTFQVIMAVVGFIASIVGLFGGGFTLISRYNLYKNLMKSINNNWQKTIEGKWYSYNITYIDDVKEVTGYEWEFKYSFKKNAFIGSGVSLRDENVTYKDIILDFIGDYIFLTGDAGHTSEKIFGIIYGHFPLDVKGNMKCVFMGLSYVSRIPFSTEMILMKNKPDLDELNNEILNLDLKSQQFDIRK